MPTPTKKSKAKNLMFSLILLALFFLLIEVVLSVFLYHRHSDEKLATIEAVHLLKAALKGKPSPVNVPNQNLVRPDSTEDINRRIAEETHLSNQFSYQSWIEFQNIDYNGKYISVKDGVRRSVPDRAGENGRDTLVIYFFGGSTMFGFNVSDAETIPSQFVRLYKARNPDGRPLRVYNVATPTYYSYQELIQFANFLFRDRRPDIAIFLDGINDFWFGMASYYDQSYFSYIFKQVFRPEVLQSGKIVIKDSADMMYRDPENIPLQQYNDRLLSNYIRAMNHAKQMGNSAGVKTYFFCQPVPFYHYPNQQSDPICFKDTNTRFDYIYSRIEKQADSLPDFVFLGNMLQQEKGYPFVDGLHYSPGFIKKITDSIYQHLAPELASDN